MKDLRGTGFKRKRRDSDGNVVFNWDAPEIKECTTNRWSNNLKFPDTCTSECPVIKTCKNFKNNLTKS